MDISKILNDKEISLGFSIQQEGDHAFLFYGLNNLAQFYLYDFSGEEELKKKVYSFIELNKQISLSCEPFLVEMVDDSIKQIKGVYCSNCGKGCEKPCKFILSLTENFLRDKWLYWASKN